MRQTNERVDYRNIIRAYHALPFFALLVLLVVFWYVASKTGSVLLGGLTGSVPTFLLLWFWVRAARQLDRWLCPRCHKPFPKKISWTYPPKVCPNCGEPLLKKNGAD